MERCGKEDNCSPSEFCVDSLKKYNAIRVISTALPNLQQLSLQYLGGKYSDGEDPDERRAAETRSFSTHDIEIVSNFAKLRSLTIYHPPLNGRYAVLFNFPLLQKLNIDSSYLKWDLEMLEGLPSLQELHVGHNSKLSGNINSLRVLKDTLEMVKIYECPSVEGNFMALADFPRLKELVLQGTTVTTTVTGDIRDISKNDFTAIEKFHLPKSVYGGFAYEFQSIAEVSDFISRIYPLVKQNEKLFRDFYWQLSKESPDWYDIYHTDDDDVDVIPPPLEFELVIITGSRVGWRWKSTDCYSDNGHSVEEMTIPCEINWLEPEPDRESSGYKDYTRKLDALENEIGFYRGYNKPPTEEEYHRLCEQPADYYY